MRKLMWFTLGFSTACFVCAYLTMNGLLWLALSAFVLSGGCVALTRWKRAFRIGAVLCLGLAVGFSGFWVFDSFYLRDARKMNGETVQLLIVADDYSVPSNSGCVVEGTTYLGDKPYKVRAYLRGHNSVQPGDLIEGSFRLKFTADGGRDVSPQYRGKGIFLTASQRGDSRLWEGAYFGWQHYPALWRSQLKALIDGTFTQDTAAFATALLLGDKTDLDFAIETAFKISGISHIIAVSGLHVSILFGLIYLVSARKRVLTALIGIPAVLVFAAVVGFSPSVTRACLMQILMMLALLFKREYDPPTALSFAVLAMLAVNPLVITSVSFQLSVSCMAGIFLFSGKIRGWLMDKKRLGRWGSKSLRGKFAGWFSGSVSVSVSAVILTTPLTAYYFGTVSLVGILTNLLTLWVVTFVFYGILAVCLFGTFSSSLAAGLAAAVSWPIRYIFAVSKGLSAIPFAAVYTESIFVVIWLAVSYILLAVFLCTKGKHGAVLSSTSLALLLLAIASSWVIPALDSYRVTVLNVGQGQCILLQSEGRTYLVDCGGDHDETAANIAADTLLSQGITRLDGVIVTHYDADHSGGIPYLLNRVDTDLLYLPDTLDENNMAQKILDRTSAVVNIVREDLMLCFGQSKLTIFAADSYNSANESSLCILFQSGNCDILITGDRGAMGEEMLLKRHEIPDLELLVVGHHGSATSTSELLLEQTRPDYALISVSEDNSYGHPSQTVLDRLAQFGCIVYRTDRDGHITFRG